MAALLEYTKARAILDRYGIRSVESAYVGSASEAEKFAGGNPIVLKAISGKALHKSHSGLVVAGLNSGGDILRAYDGLQRRARKFAPYRILAQRMIQGGVEIIVGGKTDEQFGKLVLLGLGGVYVETFKDFALRVCPITERDAYLMISQLKSASIIAPDKGAKRMLASLLVKAARMFYESDLGELDLNPVILHDGTYDAVDLRLMG